MYTRSYFTEDKKVDIPENYNGNAFRESGGNRISENNDENGIFPNEEIKSEEKCEDAKCSARPFSLFDRFSPEGIFVALPFKSFRNIF